MRSHAFVRGFGHCATASCAIFLHLLSPPERGFYRRFSTSQDKNSLVHTPFGHIKASCKSQLRCVHCGEKGHSFSYEHCQQSQLPPKCANCQGNHRADSPTCPEFLMQQEIRKYSATRNISLLDAKEIFKGNRTPPSFSSSSEEFPPLSHPHLNSHPSYSNLYYPQTIDHTSPHLSYVQASKTFLPSHSQPLPFPTPTRDIHISKLSSFSQPTRTNKNSHDSPSSHKIPRPSVSFPSLPPSISVPSTTHPAPSPFLTNSTPLSSDSITTPQDAIILITTLIIKFLPLFSSSNLLDLLPAITQFLRNLPSNSAHTPPLPE